MRGTGSLQEGGMNNGQKGPMQDGRIDDDYVCRRGFGDELERVKKISTEIWR